MRRSGAIIVAALSRTYRLKRESNVRGNARRFSRGSGWAPAAAGCKRLLSCTMHDQTTECSYLLRLGESGCQKGELLFGHRHVELLILKAVVTEEMIAHQVCASGLQNRPNGCMEVRCVSLVTELMNCLVRDHGIKGPESKLPIGVLETSFEKGHPSQL